MLVVGRARFAALSLFFITLLAGRYSIARLAGGALTEQPDVPPFLDSLTSEIRYPCFALLFMALLLNKWPTKATGRPACRLAAWTLSVVALHGYIVLSSFWPGTIDGQVFYRMFEAVQLIGLILVAERLFSTATEQMTISFFALCLAAAVLYAAGGISGQWHLDDRMAAFGGGPNIFVRVVGTGLLVSLYLWAKTGSWWWVAACPPLLISAVLSGSRGGMLGLAVAIPLLLVFVLRLVGRRAWQGLAVLSVVGLALNLTPSLMTRLNEFWNQRFVELTFNERYASSRDSLFEFAWNQFSSYPVIGTGLNGFEQATGGMYPYPHNLVLNVACEGGVIGLAFLAMPFCLLFARCFRPMTLEQKTALCAGLFYLVASMFSGTYYDARFMWIFFLISMQAGNCEPEQESSLKPSACFHEVLAH